MRPPAEEHVGQAGCFYDGSVDLGLIAGQRWWHIDEFPDIESAMKAVTPQSYVRVIFGRALVQTVNDKADWSASGRRRPTVATIALLRIGASSEF